MTLSLEPLGKEVHHPQVQMMSSQVFVRLSVKPQCLLQPRQVRSMLWIWLHKIDCLPHSPKQTQNSREELNSVVVSYTIWKHRREEFLILWKVFCEGNWHIIVATNKNLSRIDQVSAGIQHPPEATSFSCRPSLLSSKIVTKTHYITY